MKLHCLFASLAASLLILICGARHADAREGSSNYSGRTDSDRTGRLAQRDQDRTQREEARKKADEDQQKQRDERKKQAEAKKLEQAKKLDEAKKKADDARAAKKTAVPSKTAQAKTSQPDTGEQDAAKLIEQAEAKFAEGKMESILQGAKLLQQAVDEHGATDAAAKAESRLEQLLAMPELGPKLMLAQANDLFAAQRYRKALNAFTALLDAFPDSAEAAEAKQRTAEIRNGNLLEKTVYTDKELEDARLWLLTGNIHNENSRPSDAGTAWRKVVEDFPGCRFAKEAGEHLAALPKS